MKYATYVSMKCRSKKGADRETAGKTALNVIDRIISDARFAENFFFVEMLPKMSALAESYNRTYGIEIPLVDVCCATYLSCFEDDWAKLRAFKGETTPHSWISRIASQSIYQHLIDEKYINAAGENKASDYRLTIRGIEDDSLRQIIVNLVTIPDQHKALELYYVKKSEITGFTKYFGSVDKGKEILKMAESTLVYKLLNTENPYADIALSLKKTFNREIRLEQWHDRIDDDDLSENHYALRERLCQIYHCDDWDENVRNLVEAVMTSLGWNDIQAEVWRQRFLYDTPSKELAERLNTRNTWVDNTYSRLNKQFRVAIKAWWNKYESQYLS